MSPVTRRALAALAVLVSATGAPTQSGWLQIHPSTAPAGRQGHAMAYDFARSRVVLFGGANGGGSLADTWEWDGTNWSRRNPTSSPSARYAHLMDSPLRAGVDAVASAFRPRPKLVHDADEARKSA